MNSKTSKQAPFVLLVLFSLNLLVGGLSRGDSSRPLEWQRAEDLPLREVDGVYDGVGFVLSDTLFYGAGYKAKLLSEQPLDKFFAAPFSQEGVPLSWQEIQGPQGNSHVGATTAADGGRVYLVGGQGSIPATSPVFSFDGARWRSERPISQTLEFPAVAALNGRLYVAGGLPGPTNKVWSAAIGEDGILGEWREEAPLPFGMVTRLAAWNANDRRCLYAIGGKDDLGNPHREIYSATLDIGGAITAWVTMTRSLPQPLADHGVAVRNGVLYVAGGETFASLKVYTVYSTTISTGCALSEWSLSASLPEGKPRSHMAFVASDKGLYLIGGQLATGPAKDTWYGLLSVPRETHTPTRTLTPTPSLTLTKTPTSRGAKAYLPLLLSSLSRPSPTPTATPWCDPYEPNDDRRVNPWGPIVSGQVIQAKICQGDPQDNYYFDATTTDTIQIRLQLPGTLVKHTVIALYSAADLSQAVCWQAPVIVADFTLRCPTPQTGRYIIRLYTDGVSDDVNPYTLTAIFR